MSVTNEYFKQAELALAAYVNLANGAPDIDKLQDEGRGMSLAQATRFSTQWTVVAQYNQSELIPVLDEFNQPTGEYAASSNGLSVTVFQENATGQKYLAIRGTDDLYDAATDLVSVGILGSTRFQAQYQSLRLKVQEWMGNGTLPAQFTVTGHSLGGFLATGLASEFSANVSHAYLYNAPGIGGIATATEIGMRLLSALNITSSLPGADKFSNIRADAGVSPIAGLGLPVSPPIQIAIENQFLSDIPNPPAARNHSQQTLTDALAVYAAYAVLAPSLNEAQITQLLKSASATNKGTLESALDALRTTLLGAGIVLTPEEDRGVLHANLYDLQASAAYQGLKGGAVVKLTAVQGADTLAANAKSDFGAFLAVKYLLPVVIEGSWAVLSTIHTDLHAQWQADRTNRTAGNIDLNFTDAYLADRSAFLTWKNHLALRDRSAAAAPYTDAPDAFFRDYATSLTIHLGATLTDSTAKPRYLFGADQASGVEMLEGGTNADRIYGGGGVDHLYGYGGRDHLEGGAGDDRLTGGDGDDTLIGGAGDDRLEGGLGFDTYIVGQGVDTIVDEDGKGVVKDGQGRILAGVFLQGADGRYTWAGNPAVGATHNSPLTITLENGAQVVIDNYGAFAEGELGIHLLAAPTPLTPARTIQGDLEPIDTDPSEPGVQTASDELGNPLVSGEAPGRADHLYDSAGSDLIQSGGGADRIDASRGGARAGYKRKVSRRRTAIGDSRKLF